MISLLDQAGGGYASLETPAFGWWGQQALSFNEQVQVPAMTMAYWREQLAAHPEWKALVHGAVGYALQRPGAPRRALAKQVARDLNQISSTLDQLTTSGGPLRAEFNSLAGGVFGNSIDDDMLTGKGMAYAEFVAPTVTGLLQKARQAVADQGELPVARSEEGEPPIHGPLRRIGNWFRDLGGKGEEAADAHSEAARTTQIVLIGGSAVALASLGAYFAFRSKDDDWL